MKKKQRERCHQIARRAGYVKSCKGKRRYPSENQARIAAMDVSNKSSRTLSHYTCPYCNKWHIGGNIIEGYIQ